MSSVPPCATAVVAAVPESADCIAERSNFAESASPHFHLQSWNSVNEDVNCVPLEVLSSVAMLMEWGRGF